MEGLRGLKPTPHKGVKLDLLNLIFIAFFFEVMVALRGQLAVACQIGLFLSYGGIHHACEVFHYHGVLSKPKWCLIWEQNFSWWVLMHFWLLFL